MLKFQLRHEYWVVLLVVILLQLAKSEELFFKPFNVSYDHRALIIDGKRRMLISAGIHYPRATPQVWPDLIAKAKEGGADVIQSYTFWNLHEPIRGQYNFQGRGDIVKFVKLVGSYGLYFHLRIGPYVCAEWNFGGFPVWLRDTPGIEFRTDNAPFKEEMQRYVKMMVDMMKQEKLFSWQGGPIILLQIENEYGNIESSYGQKGKEYVKWAARMALGLGAGVPWVMCRQTDAPENIVDTCNGFYCDGFKPNSYKKPTFWTEDWNGWYTTWGGTVPHRPVEDNAFAVARFFQRGGSFHNYYMYFGGTNFGRTSGGPFYVTSYDYDAPIDEYGRISQPKWGHLKDLHAAIKLCEPALVAVDNSPQYIKLGLKQEAHIYHRSVQTGDLNLSRSGDGIGLCSAFLANIDEVKEATVRFNGRQYTLPPWSVSILPDCKTVAFNTAKVGAQVSVKTLSYYSGSTKTGQLLLQNEVPYSAKAWMALKEPIGAWGDNNFTVQGILEHLNVTKDTSDYLWYVTRIHISEEDIASLEANEDTPILVIGSIRDVAHIFINGKFAGSAAGHWVRVTQPVHLLTGHNEIAILSETVGLQNYGAFLEKDGAGLKGQIKLTGLKSGELDLSNSLWTHQVGLKGEFMKLYDPDRHDLENWVNLSPDALPSRFTWYKAYFNVPTGVDPVAINLGSMMKGQVWINGHHIGRYWSRIAPEHGCQETCNYRGAYTENKCAKNCGKPTQIWYHIPRAWLNSEKNLLVMFEEIGGNPFDITIKLHYTKTLCGQVSQSHLPPLHVWSHPQGKISNDQKTPEMHLQCDNDYIISEVAFASYGTPHGTCEKFSRGHCHAHTSLSVVSEACIGKNSCAITVSDETFGDPCRGTIKTLAVEARCISSSTSNADGIAQF